MLHQHKVITSEGSAFIGMKY